MSTSSSAPVQVREAPEVRPFAYPDTQGSGAVPMAGSAEPVAGEELARDAGRKEGEARARAALEQELINLRASMQTAIGDFARERAIYYQKVEAEVVQLALSIARKILHRESQIDPLLLAGIVRVALDKLEGGTRVLVRVHPQHAAEWRGYFARYMDPRDVPEVVDDPALAIDRCVIETNVGTTELGLEVQLKEIERGLADLMALRP
jgi:flagellar assembly protein FliH